MQFGERLKSLRKERDLTQQDIANVLGVGRATIAGYETKGKQPDYEKLNQLANYFNTSVDYLLGRTDIKNPENKDKEMERLANKEIKSVEDALEIIKFQDGLMLNGKILNDEDKMLLANALQLGMKYVLEQEEKRRKKGEKKNK